MTDEINEYRRDSKGVPLVAGLIFLVFLAAVASFFYGVRFVRHDPKLTIIEVNYVKKRERNKSAYRAKVDDESRSVFAHDRSNCFYHPKCSIHICIKLLFYFLYGKIFNRSTSAKTCIIYQNIDSTPFFFYS